MIDDNLNEDRNLAEEERLNAALAPPQHDHYFEIGDMADAPALDGRPERPR